MCLRPGADVVDGHRFASMHEGLPLVVLADVENRQPPGGREIERLVEDAFARRAVAEEGRDNAAGLATAHRLGQGDAGGHGEFAAHDRRGQHDAELTRGDVQGSALATAVAVHAAEHLGHHAARRGAAGKQVPRAAVVGEDPVARLEGVDDADRGRLLADRRAGSRGAGRPVDLDEPAFVGPDQQHRFEQRETGRHWFSGHDVSLRVAGGTAGRYGRNEGSGWNARRTLRRPRAASSPSWPRAPSGPDRRIRARPRTPTNWRRVAR